MVQLAGTPVWDPESCKGAQSEEAQDTYHQEEDAKNQHTTVLSRSTNDTGVLQQALLAVWMTVAHQWRQGNGAHSRERDLRDKSSTFTRPRSHGESCCYLTWRQYQYHTFRETRAMARL